MAGAMYIMLPLSRLWCRILHSHSIVFRDSGVLEYYTVSYPRKTDSSRPWHVAHSWRNI